MTKLLCLHDAYLKTCTAVIQQIDCNCVLLDQTVCYPQGGGQPSDTGHLDYQGKTYRILKVAKKDGNIWHELDTADELTEGAESTVHIDWEHRYTLMRMHTAAHTLASVFHKEAGAQITGNQLGIETTRFDFNLKEFDRELVEKLVNRTNELLNENHEVKIYLLPREEANKIEGIVKLANSLPPHIDKLRIVEIVDVDMQADGGTHVKNTKEVGHITITKMSNKGSGNRRVYFSLS